MKYRKKSIEVEAVQWDGRNGTFLKIKKMDDSNGIYLSGDFNNVITICSMNKELRANVGDYIVKLSSGEICCLNAKKFEAMYEQLESVNREPTQECEAVAVEPCLQERMQAEYHDLKTRYEKLHRMVTKYEAGTLDFTPNCSLDLLRQQKRHMGEYLHDLEIRAEVEGIEL